MSKGGGTTRTVASQTGVDETTRPYKEFGLTEARRLYEQGPQQYYPGQTVVGFSPETEMSLSGMRQQAISGSPFIGAVQDVVMQNLTGTNPLQSAAMRPVMEAIEGKVSQAGRYGSGYGDAAMVQALAPFAYQAQQQAVSQAPAAREFGFADLATLGGVGQAREGLEQAQLASDIERFQFEQMAPQAGLANYLASVQGGQIGSQAITPQYRQPALQALGGALGGAQIGDMVEGFSPSTGAILGAGLGLLG